MGSAGLDCYDLPCSILPSFSRQLIGSGAAPEQLIQAGELSLSESPFYLQEVKIQEWVFEVKAKYWGWPNTILQKSANEVFSQPNRMGVGINARTNPSHMQIGNGGGGVVRWAGEAE